MKKNSKLIRLSALAGVLPFIYGCGGSGTSGLLGTLFGGVGGFVSGGGGGIFSSGGSEFGTLHQPEPASMLLIGGGLAALTYFKTRNSHKGKS